VGPVGLHAQAAPDPRQEVEEGLVRDFEALQLAAAVPLRGPRTSTFWVEPLLVNERRNSP
jgi:hypothetical protein